jgi:hypothetical protein
VSMDKSIRASRHDKYQSAPCCEFPNVSQSASSPSSPSSPTKAGFSAQSTFQLTPFPDYHPTRRDHVDTCPPLEPYHRICSPSGQDTVYPNVSSLLSFGFSAKLQVTLPVPGSILCGLSENCPCSTVIFESCETGN